MKQKPDIPAGWKNLKLKKLLTQDIKNGYSPICPDDPNGSWILSLGNLTENGFDPTQAKPAPKGDSRVKDFLLEPGDFLISRSNTLDKVGRSMLFRGEIENCSYPDLLMRFRVDETLVINEYLEGYLRSSMVRKYIQSCASGTSGSMVKINKTTVEKIPVVLPPHPEQRAIANLLSTWNEAIEKTERLIQAKESSLKGQIQKLISQRCDSWPHVKPKKIFDTITEKNFPDEELLSVTQNRGVIPRRMLEGRVMSPDGTTASYKLIKRGDFAISLRSFQGGIEYSNYQGIVSPAYTVLRPKIELNRDFYRLFFKSYIFIEKYLNLAVIGIRDGKQISIPDFLSIKIPVPPFEEQKEIAKTLSVCQHEIDLLKLLKEKYKTQKRGLMQKMLTGKWRVKPEIVKQYMEA